MTKMVVESMRINTSKGKKEGDRSGMEQFSKIWRINMKRYGKDLEEK